MCADQLESGVRGAVRRHEAWTGHHRRRTKGMVTIAGGRGESTWYETRTLSEVVGSECRNLGLCWKLWGPCVENWDSVRKLRSPPVELGTLLEVVWVRSVKNRTSIGSCGVHV